MTAKLIQWADLIFAMEKRHKQRLLERFSEEIGGRQIIVLDIPDHYPFMDPELIGILQQSVSPYLEEDYE
ncbi:hypothetical protein GCM10028810_42060 [Spirosoma litoris]